MTNKPKPDITITSVPSDEQSLRTAKEVVEDALASSTPNEARPFLIVALGIIKDMRSANDWSCYKELRWGLDNSGQFSDLHEQFNREMDALIYSCKSELPPSTATRPQVRPVPLSQLNIPNR